MPLFSVTAGNRLELLVRHFLERQDKLRMPFETRTVVVQNRGMERYLRLETATAKGICCGVDFPFPVMLAYDLFNRVLQDIPRVQQDSQAVMTWRILDRLRDLPEQDTFAPVREYLRDAPMLSRWQLAREIARTFDRYLIFRPDMILSWDEGRPVEMVAEHQDWQAELWRTIHPAAAIEHRTRLRRRFLQAVASCPLDGLPRGLTFFAVASLPDFHMDIFEAVAKRIPVTFYLLEPSGDDPIPTGEKPACFAPSMNWNRSGENFRARFAAPESNKVNLFSPPAEPTVLAMLQRDLLGTREGTETLHADPPPLESLSMQVHSCHGPMREVQVLLDNVLWILQNKPGIEPRDILVISPDLQRYRGYIQAVFDSCGDPRRKVPYAVASQEPTAPPPLIRTFLHVLDIPLDRWRNDVVLELLECPAIRSRFEFSESDIPLLTGWLDQAGALWGVDGRHKEELGLPAFDDYTWSSASMRLVLGHALPERDKAVYQGVAPLGLVEGSDASVLGHFQEFLSTLYRVLAPLGSPAALAEWKKRLDTILEQLFDVAFADELEQMRLCLAEAASAQCLAAGQERVDLAVVKTILREGVGAGFAARGLFTGKVTFSDMNSLRGVPFKVVAILGLSDEFPRRDRRPGFDLMAASPLPGDPKQRDDDRRLFLEAILSAREMLLVSYQGRTQTQNVELPPSILVSELLDHIRSRYAGTSKKAVLSQIVREHHLQPYHPEYFRQKADSQLFSFSTENLACLGRVPKAPPAFSSRLPEKPGLLPNPLPLSLLRAFFDNPAKFFLEKRLGLFLPRDRDVADSTEPLDGLDTLSSYFLHSDVLDALLIGKDLESMRGFFKSSNSIPPGTPGDIFLEDAGKLTSDLYGKIAAWGSGRSPKLECGEVDLGGFILTGEVARIYPRGMLRVRPASIKPKDLLRGWLEHLFLNSLGGKPRVTAIIGFDGERIQFSPPDDPKATLSSLADILAQGMREPLPFFPKTSLEYAQARCEEGLSHSKALAKTNSSWNGIKNRYVQIPGECEDLHFARCFPDEEHFENPFFAETALAIYTQLLDTMEKVDAMS